MYRVTRYYLDWWLGEWVVESIDEFQFIEDARRYGDEFTIEDVISDNPVVEVDYEIEKVP